MSTCVFLSADPVPGTVSATDRETGAAVAVTAHAYNPRLYFLDASVGREITLTYDALGAAVVTYTPPELLTPHPPPGPPPTPPPGEPVTTTTIEDVGETLFVYHEQVTPYLTVTGQTARQAAFVDLSHEPYTAWPAYHYLVQCEHEYYNTNALNIRMKRDVFQSREGQKVRLMMLTPAMTGQTHERLVPSGSTIFAVYKRLVTTTVEPEPGQSAPAPIYTRQPGCSAAITATMQDGSIAGVTGRHNISVRDSYEG